MPNDKMHYRIKITRNGPYLLSGSIPLNRMSIVSSEENGHLAWATGSQFPPDETYALCRCGKSSSKPFCDGSHLSAGFDGTANAGQDGCRDRVVVQEGPTLILHDHEELCSAANFCHRMESVWNAVERSDEERFRDIALYEASCCPSGRLVLEDRLSGKPCEREYEPSVSLVEDRSENVSGPIWVKGSIPIESDEGLPYPERNRVTLCRCGLSKNKPFCDGTHVDVGFKEQPPCMS